MCDFSQKGNEHKAIKMIKALRALAAALYAQMNETPPTPPPRSSFWEAAYNSWEKFRVYFAKILLAVPFLY